MKIWDLLRTSNRNLFRSKLRTLLTVMAIFVGSFTLTLTNGVGDGLRDYIETQVKNIEGDSIMFVRKKFPQEDELDRKPGEPIEYKEIEEDSKGNSIDPNSILVTTDQIKTVTKDVEGIKNITPAYRMNAEYITLGTNKKYQVDLGMFSQGLVQKLEAGSMFDGEDQIVLPLHLAKAFDENFENLIGKKATIGYKIGREGELVEHDLTIKGVATKGLMANLNAFVDSATAKRIYRRQQEGNANFEKFQRFTFLLSSADEKTIKSIKETLEAKGFTGATIADIEKRTYDAIGILQIGLNLFAFIALLAASFGIINTLVIAVMERTKEIGLQKALGMGEGQVFLLFAVESILIGFWGALLGIVGAIVAGIGINNYLAYAYLESFEGYSLFVFRPIALVLIMGLVCLIAFLAGVLPAFRASRLNPIEALRYE